MNNLSSDPDAEKGRRPPEAERESQLPTQAGAAVYLIRVKGSIHSRWSNWLEGLTITPVEGGETVLSGPIADQAALHGLLAKVRDMNLELISVRRGWNPGE